MLSLQSTSPDEALAADAAVAAKAFSKLVPASDRRHRVSRISLDARDQSRQARAEVPMEIFRLFIEVLEQLAQGHAVTLVPGGKELTTQQAADMINVSRPYLIQLLEEGRIPFRRVGTRRRVRFEDLLAFQRRDDADRKKAADALAKEAEELGLEY
jgi:excisionase family DNA binding protein